MKKIIIILTSFVILPVLLSAGWFDKGKKILNSYTKTTSKNKNQLSLNEIQNGLKEALKVGVQNVVQKLGKVNGFYNDKNVHIPLPDKLRKIKDTLNGIGMGKRLNDLELKMNRAAEIATLKVKKLFWKAISEMTINDVNKIYHGPDDAATQYFKNKMTNPLKLEMSPVIEKSLNEVQAVKLYNSIINKYNSLPFVKPVNFNLTDYVLGRAIDGIFFYLAKEEAAIRKNPVKRTTELLKKVFGNLNKRN